MQDFVHQQYESTILWTSPPKVFSGAIIGCHWTESCSESMFGGRKISLQFPLFVVGYMFWGRYSAAKKPRGGIQSSIFEDVFVHFHPDMFMLLSPSLSCFQVLFLVLWWSNGLFVAKDSAVGSPPVFSQHVCCSKKKRLQPKGSMGLVYLPIPKKSTKCR